MKNTLIALALCFTGATQASTGPGLVLMPFAKGKTAEINISNIILSDTKTTNDVDVDIFQNDISARFLLNAGEANALTLGFESHHISIDTSSAILPRQLNDQSIAIGYDLGQCDENKDWSAKAIIGVGFAGNKAYQDSDAIYFKGDFIVTKKIDNMNSWVFTLNYDGNRSFMPDVPLPSITYIHAERNLQYGIGLPYSFVNYKFNANTNAKATFTLGGISAKLNHKLNDKLSLYASYESITRSFMIKTHVDHDRIFFKQSRAEIGASYQVSSNLNITAGFGHVFDQEFEQGFDTRNLDLVTKLDDESYFQVGFKLAF